MSPAVLTLQTSQMPIYRGLSVPLGFPGYQDGNDSACNVGDPGLIPGLARPPGEGTDNTPVFLPGKSDGQGFPGRLESMGSQRARHSWATNTHTPAPLKFTMVCEEAEESCKVTWSLGSRRASGWGQGEGTGPSSLEWSLVYRMLANSHAPGWTRWIMTHTVNTVQSLRGEKSDMNDHFQHTWLCLQVWIIEKIFQRLL